MHGKLASGLSLEFFAESTEGDRSGDGDRNRTNE